MRTAVDTNVVAALWSREPISSKMVQLLGRAQADGGLPSPRLSTRSCSHIRERRGHSRRISEIRRGSKSISIWENRSGGKPRAALPPMPNG